MVLEIIVPILALVHLPVRVEGADPGACTDPRGRSGGGRSTPMIEDAHNTRLYLLGVKTVYMQFIDEALTHVPKDKV